MKLKRYPLGFTHLYYTEGSCLCATLNRAGKRSSCRLAYKSVGGGKGGAAVEAARRARRQPPRPVWATASVVSNIRSNSRLSRPSHAARSCRRALKPDCSSSRLWTNISAPASKGLHAASASASHYGRFCWKLFKKLRMLFCPISSIVDI